MRLNNRTKLITTAGITAAFYVVITFIFSAISFNNDQFRLSEIMNLLAFIHPAYGVGVTLGCFISNLLFSPLGIVDVIVGTIATGLAVYCISKTKRLLIASLWPTFFCILVSIEISILLNLPFLITTFSVLLGEFFVVTVCGYPIFKYIILKNKSLMKYLSIEEE